ncbi:hypothetical protein ACP70R_046341 [Stipagrostis hirtigluma subsp. patula]
MPPEALLLDDIVEEILLRIPPDEPERLVRAALACKKWRRLVSGPGFRRRFRDRHRVPPVLGFLHNLRDNRGVRSVRFVPTCAFRPPRADLPGWQAIDSRHGRVLLHRDKEPRTRQLVYDLAVWDPVTDERRDLPALPQFRTLCSKIEAVLCAAAGDCHHIGCSGGPFLVVVVGCNPAGAFAYVFSSEAGAWSEATTAEWSGTFYKGMRPVHAGNALYFVAFLQDIILKYNLGTREMAVIDPPPSSNKCIALMTDERGGLRAITREFSILYLWSREAGPDGDMVWVQNRVVELESLMPAGASFISFNVVDSADGGAVVYMGTEHGFFTADLRTGQVRKLEWVRGFDNVVPYMSFYTPALDMGSTGEGPRPGGSSA